MLKNRLPFCPKTIEFNCWSFVQRCLTLNEMPSWPSTFLKLKTKWLLSVKSGLSGLLGLCVQKKKFLEKSLTKRFFICFRFNTCSAMSVFTGPSDHILRWKRAKGYIIDASFFFLGGGRMRVDALGRGARKGHHSRVIQHVPYMVHVPVRRKC